MSELYHLNKYLRKYKYRFLLGIFFIVGTHIFSIIPARLTKNTFDFLKGTLDTYQIFQGANFYEIVFQILFKGLLAYIALILLMAFLKSLCSFLMRQIIMKAANKIEAELKNEIYNHYQNLPLSFYTKHSTGDLMARIVEDVNRVKLYLGPALLFALNGLVLFLILIPYMIYINPKLTLYSLFPLPVLAISVYYIKHFLYYRSERLQAKLAELTIFVQETFSGIRVLQAFAREQNFVKNFSNTCESYKQYALSVTAINAIFTPLAMGINSLGIILTVLIGGKEVIKGNITVGNIAEFVMYMHLITWPIITISLVANFIQRAAASQKRINEFLKEENPIVSTQNIIRPIQGKITFENVSFTYPDTGIRALNNISFEIAAGESVAIFGTTGSGKSTIASLLTRLYEADSGSILIDDTIIQAYNIAGLREQIGYVPQDVFLFPDTIKNNIAFGKKDVNEAQIEQVIQYAGLYTSLQHFPNHIETLVGERGVTLSGGQKQRIAIARALIREPRLLILDNSLSAVDTKTEHSILQNLKRVMQGRTTVIISHSISAASLCNKILVLEAGNIVEQGSHEELLAAKGIYHKLYKQQGS
ncbi:MAG: ABC transporter ATP-binding protein [Candidatus Amoebophilus sp.]